MESSTFGHVTDWNEVMKKEARGRNDADLGEVMEVKRQYCCYTKRYVEKRKILSSKINSIWI